LLRSPGAAADSLIHTEFINRKVHDLLIRAVDVARANGRDIIRPIDLPITKGPQARIREFRLFGQEIELQPVPDDMIELPPLEPACAGGSEAQLPDIAGARSVALARTFEIKDPDLENPHATLGARFPHLRPAAVSRIIGAFRLGRTGTSRQRVVVPEADQLRSIGSGGCVKAATAFSWSSGRGKALPAAWLRFVNQSHAIMRTSESVQGCSMMKIDVSYDALLQALVEAIRNERDHGAAVMSLVSRLVEQACQQGWFKANWKADARLRLAQMTCGHMPKGSRSALPVLEVIAEAARWALKADEVDSESRAVLLAIMRLADVERPGRMAAEARTRPVAKHARQRKARGAVRRGRTAAQPAEPAAAPQAMASAAAKPAAAKARKAKRAKPTSRTGSRAKPATSPKAARTANGAAAAKGAQMRKARRAKPIKRSASKAQLAKPAASPKPARTANGAAPAKGAQMRKARRAKPIRRSASTARLVKPAASPKAARTANGAAAAKGAQMRKARRAKSIRRSASTARLAKPAASPKTARTANGAAAAKSAQMRKAKGAKAIGPSATATRLAKAATSPKSARATNGAVKGGQMKAKRAKPISRSGNTARLTKPAASADRMARGKAKPITAKAAQVRKSKDVKPMGGASLAKSATPPQPAPAVKSSVPAKAASNGAGQASTSAAVPSTAT
jgi:hypothetical protein